VSITGGASTGGTGTQGGAVSMTGGAGAGATGGAITIESGAGTATSSGPITIKSKDAGSAGASGKLEFKSGTSSVGNTGAILIGSGDAGSGGSAGNGGAVTISVGGGTAGATGGHLTLSAGGANTGSGAGGNLYLKPGNGQTRGAVYFKDDVASDTTYGTISAATFDFTATGSVSIVSSGTAALSGTVVTLTGSTGISMGASHVYNFESGTGTFDDGTLNKMSGVVTTSTNNLAAGSEVAVTVTNSRVSTTSQVYVTLASDCGAGTLLSLGVSAVNNGSFTAKFKNIDTVTDCSQAFKYSFLVIN
jgi:hypothetical protein